MISKCHAPSPSPFRGTTLILTLTLAGKSLTYQLPALFLPRLTLVISPLLSLMADQAAHLPASVPGACLSSQQTMAQSAEVFEGLRQNRYKVTTVRRLDDEG